MISKFFKNTNEKQALIKTDNNGVAKRKSGRVGIGLIAGGGFLGFLSLLSLFIYKCGFYENEREKNGLKKFAITGGVISLACMWLGVCLLVSERCSKADKKETNVNNDFDLVDKVFRL